MLFFFIIFPAVANIGSVRGKAISDSSLSQLVLNVAIPCSGHAPLIISELKTIDGVKDVQYDSGNFIVKYDSYETTKEEILKLKIFEEYKAKEV